MMLTQTQKYYIVPLLLSLLTACSNHSVQAWQKQDLSRLEMQFEANSTQRSFDSHFYFSKEGSSGGEGFAGGGCGCN